MPTAWQSAAIELPVRHNTGATPLVGGLYFDVTQGVAVKDQITFGAMIGKTLDDSVEGALQVKARGCHGRFRAGSKPPVRAGVSRRPRAPQ